MVYKLANIADPDQLPFTKGRVMDILYELTSVLTHEYGADRDVDNDDGGYVLMDTTTSLVVNNIARLEEYGGVAIVNVCPTHYTPAVTLSPVFSFALFCTVPQTLLKDPEVYLAIRSSDRSNQKIIWAQEIHRNLS